MRLILKMLGNIFGGMLFILYCGIIWWSFFVPLPERTDAVSVDLSGTSGRVGEVKGRYTIGFKDGNRVGYAAVGVEEASALALDQLFSTHAVGSARALCLKERIYFGYLLGFPREKYKMLELHVNGQEVIGFDTSLAKISDQKQQGRWFAAMLAVVLPAVFILQRRSRGTHEALLSKA